MKDFKRCLFLILLVVLVEWALYITQPTTPPVASENPPVITPLKSPCPCKTPCKPKPMVIKTLVDYYADWCGPCKTAKPVVDKLEKEGVIVKRVNADRDKIETMNANVTSLPTFVCWRQDGDIVRQIRTQNINEVVRFFK